MTRFAIAPEAARDIEEIVEYIAKDSATAALKVQDQILDTFLHLARFPHSGHIRRIWQEIESSSSFLLKNT